jgi:hypothetical protein
MALWANPPNSSNVSNRVNPDATKPISKHRKD